MSQPANLGRLLCQSKFELQLKNHKVKNWEGSNLIYVVIRIKYKYIGEMSCLVKERFNIYGQHKTVGISTIGIGRTFTYLKRRKISYVSFH